MPVFDPQRFQQFKETGVLEAPVFSPEKLEQFKETGQLPITPEPAGVDLTTPPKVTSGEIDTSQWIKSKPETTDIPPDTVILSLSQKPEGIDPVMKTIMLFEAGPVARRNKNPGNVQYTKELGEKFQAKKGEAYTDSTGAVRYHAVFPSEELGIAATRFIANNIWERAGKDPVKFASIYTGLPEGSNTVHNYAKSIQSNLKGRVVPPVIKEEWEPEEKPVYIPYKAITGETHYYRVPTQEETLAKQVKEDGLVEQAIKNTLYRGADIFLFGGGKRLFEAPALTQLLDLHIAKTGFFKDNPTMQIARVLMGMGEASGTALSFMAPSSAFKAIGLTGKLASAATFSTVGGLRRVLDPDIQKGMTWDKWVVGTSLDAVLGAVFPWLGKLGGSVLEQPSTVKAFGQFLLQSGAISTAMDAASFTETFYGALRDNPDKKALDVFNEVATQFISHPEQLVKNFATMAFLHSTSVGFRFLKGGKLFAEQQATFIKQMGDMAKELPEWTRKAPQTMQEAQRFYNTWMDVTYKRMLNVSEAADFLKKQRLVREKQAEQVKRTQKQMAEAKERKKAVEVPVTGEEKPYATREDIIKMPTVQQIETLEDMGYHIDHIVRMSGEQRAKAVANKVAPTPGQRKPLPAKIKAKPIEMKPEPRPEEVIQPEEVKPKPVEEAPEKPPEVKPEAPPPEPGKVAETLETVRLNPKDVKTREDWFQPKTEYRQWVIDSIAEEFDPIEWKEPLLWRDDPGMGGEGTGNLIVARGHHRQKGVEKGRYADVPYKILPKGTTLEQARRIAESEPLDIPTDFENAGSVRRRLEAGDSITQIVKDMPQVAPKAKTDESRKSAIKNIANLAYLDPAGMFAEVYDLTSDFPKIVSISKWVGSLRKSYPWMTNTHEKDLFKFFYTERGAAKGDILDIKKKIKDGLEKMNGMPGDKPARLDWLHKGIVTGIEATHPEIAQEIKVKQQTLTRIRATLSEEDLTQETRKSLETDAAMLEKEITSMQEDVGRAAQQQETLFSIQRDIFGGEAQAEPTLTEAERLRQEEQREYGAQRQREQEFIEQRAKEGKLTETTADVLRKQLQAERTRELEEAGQESIFGKKTGTQESLLDEVKFKSTESPDSKVTEQARTPHDDVHFKEVEAPKEPSTKKQVTRREIVDFVRQAFNAPVFGKGTFRELRGGVMGFFNIRRGFIRTKITEDIYTLTHELAHLLDRKIWGVIKNLNPPHFSRWQLELGNLDYDQGPKGRRTREGFAEFMRHYLTTGKSWELAPTFHKWFTTEFSKDNPVVFKNIETLRNKFKIYHEQGAEGRVLGQIDFKGKGPKTTVKDKLRSGWVAFRQAFTTDVAFLEEVFYKKGGLKGKLYPSEDPVELMIGLKMKAPAKTYEWVFFGTTDWVGRKTGKSLKEIMSPISGSKEEIKKFLMYAYARRTLTRSDINTGIELSDAEHVFKKYDSKKFRKASDELHEFMNRALDYMVAGGALSSDAKKDILDANIFYIPLKRFFVDNITYRGKGGGKRIIDIGQPIKKIKGGGRAIINPLESMVIYLENMIEAADKTRIARAIKNIAEREEIGGLIHEVPPPVKAHQFSIKQTLKRLSEAGVDFPESMLLGDPTGLVTLFSQGIKYTGADNIVTIWESGKPKPYEVDSRLYRTLKGIDAIQIPPVIDFLFAKPNRLVKLGAVGLSPAFSYIANPLRDFPTYMINSNNNVPNPAAPIVGIVADLGLGSKSALEAARHYRAQGGDMATIMGQDRKTCQRMLKEVLLKSRGMKGKTAYVALHPVDALRRLFQIPEMGPRIAEMQSRIKYWESQYGKDNDAAYLKAFNEAQDVTINFSRMGYVSSYLNQLIPFFNPVIQGGSKIVRMAKERPVALITKGIATITIPALWTWWMNKDEDWYKGLPAELKYSHLYFDLSKMGGSDEVITVPLPHELGTLFGGLPMAYWDEMYDYEPKAIKEATELFLSQLNPGNPITDLAVVRPWLLAMSNRTWYGTKLESLGMQFKEVPDRYKDFTLEIAKILSRQLYRFYPQTKLSPVKIEAMMEGYTGGFAGRVAGSVDLAVGAKEIKTLADLPVLGKLFLRKELYAERSKIDWDRLKLLRQKKGSKTLTPEEKIGLKRLEYSVKIYTRRKKLKK